MNLAGLLVGLALIVPAPAQAAVTAAESESEAGAEDRVGDASLFIELFKHLEPHPLTGVWLGGSKGVGLVSVEDPEGRSDDPAHPALFHDRHAFTEHYAAEFGGGWGFMIYNINTAMWIAGLLLFVVFVPVARKAKALASGPPRGGGYGLAETFVLYVRDEMVLPNLGKEHGRRFLPLFLTMFFFILFMNLLGLLWLGPVGGTATANLAVTGGMALVTLFCIHAFGIAEHGPVKHWKNFIPHGVPGFAVPIVAAVELLGMVVKPAALMVRLFANMTAGHLIVLSLFGLIYFFGSILVAPLPLAMALFIYGLETFVALVQAYIFTYLSILFVGWSLHPDH